MREEDQRIFVYSLGGLTLHYGAQVVSGLASRKMEALVAYLAYTSRPHAREHLADLFWSDSPIEAGLANLRVMLTRLRKAFPDHLATTRQTVGLIDGRAWSDAADLVGRLGDGLNQWRASARLLPAAVGRMEEAIALYRGAFLAGVALRESAGFDEWVSVERERIVALVIDACYALAELYQAQHSPDNARRLLQLALRIDPLQEQAPQQLMRWYWENGQRQLALATYQQLRDRLDSELGAQPSSETQALYQRIQTTDPGRRPARPSPLQLPPDSSIFIGRERELAEISLRLRNPECRLLTLLGLGGVGKTRLAIAAARIMAADEDRFTDGIFFVSLADVPAALIVPAIGSTITRGGYTVETLAQLSAYLAGRRVLLILDNLDYLTDQADLFSQLLSAAPGVRLLVTSREALRLREEWLYDVHGLTCPEADTLSSLETSEAVRMLHSAATQVGLQLSLARDGREIATLCRLVDGLPLALEMAASLLRDFGIQALLEQLETSLNVLRSPLRNTPARHNSLRVLLDSVWQRLSPAERAVLMRLSVFAGSYSGEAAASVAGAKPEHLWALRTRFLVREGQGGRFNLHPLVRQYAFEKLAEDSDALIANQERHAQYYVHFLSSRSGQINSWSFRGACDAIALEMDNIRAAWLVSLHGGDSARLSEMMHPLAAYFILMDRNEQGELLFAEVAPSTFDAGLQGWLLAYRINFLQNLRRFPLNSEMLDQAEGLMRGAQDRHGLAFVQLRRVFHHISNKVDGTTILRLLDDIATLVEDAGATANRDALAAATAYFRASALSILGRNVEAAPIVQRVIAQRPQNPKLYADCLWLVGMVHFRREQMIEALAAFERALEFDRDCQFEAHYAHVLIIYGTAQMALQRYAEAEQSFIQARSYYDVVSNPGARAICDERLGELYLFTGRDDQAIAAYQRATDWLVSIQNWGGFVHTKGNIASTLEKLRQRNPLAREAYQEALYVAEREQLDSDKARALRIAGWVELVFGDYPLALRWLRESITIATRLHLMSHLRIAAQGLFRYALQTETLWLAAWLKMAFQADADTDDEILDEIGAVGVPAFTFETAPDLANLAHLLETADLSSQPAERL